ncbi:MAG: hypothetical protein AMXMBFR46_27990 [Acidimicrobiia bacterium]
MSTVLLVGAGEVGVRAARQLVDTPGVERVLVASRDRARAADVAAVLGPAGEALSEASPEAGGSVGGDGGRGGDRPVIDGGVAVVAVATTEPRAGEWSAAAVDAGVPVATIAEGVSSELEARALTAGVTIATGCGLAPGLADVLARHAAATFDAVDEVHLARVGASGGACAESVRDARRATPGEWRDGGWRADRAFGPELLWFPEPIGARECQLVKSGVLAAVATVPGARHVTMRHGAPPATGRFRGWMRRDPVDEGWGAARVEVTGWRDGVAGSVVYGVVDRAAVVAGVVLAVAAGALVGLVDVGLDARAGAAPLGALAAPVPFLHELARRGVKAAAFEGVVPAS